MASFVDEEGRQWTLSIKDWRVIQDIREKVGDERFMLYSDIIDGSLFGRLRDDFTYLCRVIEVLCEEQRKQQGITIDSFAAGFVGDTFDRATEALVDAILSFYPRSARGRLEVLVEAEKLQQQAMDKAVARVGDPALREEIRIRIENEVEAKLQELMTPLSSASSPQESSDAPPTD